MICTYVLLCSDHTFYVGSSNNLERRLTQHKNGSNKYTKSRLPVKLVFKKEFKTIKEARAYEHFIKRQRNKEFYKKLIYGAIV